MSKKRLADRRVVFVCSMTAALATVVGVLVGAPMSYAAYPQCDIGKYHIGYEVNGTVAAGQSVSVHVKSDVPATVDRNGSVRERIYLQDGSGNGFEVGLRDLGPGGSGLQAYVEWNGGNHAGDISVHGALVDSQYTLKYTNNGNNSYTLNAFNSNWGISLTKTMASGSKSVEFDASSDQEEKGNCNDFAFDFFQNSTYTRADMNHYTSSTGSPYATYAIANDSTGWVAYLPGG